MSENKYLKIKVGSEPFNDKYKEHFGGGEKTWDLRGAYQLELMKNFGLKPTKTLLDFGCGPIRAGIHFINYLNKSKYTGYDYNDSFVELAKLKVKEEVELLGKKPNLTSIINESSFESFDYILLFSVLNHATSSQRFDFFKAIKNISTSTTVIISHAHWFDDYSDNIYFKDLNYRVFHHLDIPQRLSSTLWGWNNDNEIFPLIEIRLGTCDEE
jgi:2-polyprenyl-3-methyl-5-hydroxy-6-metoxy-1,4-benzoquinol methylase